MTEKYDSRIDTMEHKVKVAYVIELIMSNMEKRAIHHDASKLESPEREMFDKYTPLLKETEYGSEEYKQYLEEMGVALDHHYENNRHHPEHFENGVEGMTLVDIVEMFCDWKAASIRVKDGDFMKSLEYNIGRFKIGGVLGKVLINTAKEMETK